MKKLFILILLASFVFGFVSSIFAMSGMCGVGGHKAEAAEEKTETEKVNNTICPVSGEEVKEKEAYQIEHEGKIYNLCCKMCTKDFKKNPQKYIEKLKESEAKVKKEGHKEGAHEEHHH